MPLIDVKEKYKTEKRPSEMFRRPLFIRGLTVLHLISLIFKEFGLSARWACSDEKMKKKTFFQDAS